MAKHGGKRKGAGRKSKAEEHALAEKLSPLEDDAMEALKSGIQSQEHWAVKLFFEYMYGKPTQGVDLTTKGKEITGFTVTIPDEEDDNTK